jgi:hypothetical protein
MAQAYELVFHCRCGKQLFGEVLLKEYERQKNELEARADGSLDPKATPDVRSTRIEESLASRRSAAGPPGGARFHDDDEGSSAKESLADRRWRERLTAGLDHDDASDGDDDLATPKRAPSRDRQPSAGKGMPAAVAKAPQKPPKDAARPAAASGSKSRQAQKTGAGKPPSRSPARPPATRSRAAARTASARPKSGPARSKSASRPTAARKPAAAPPRSRGRSAASAKRAAEAAKSRSRRKATASTRSPGRADRSRPAKTATGRQARAEATKSRRTATAKRKAAAPAKLGAGVCMWPGCGKPTRANSKYCSRACSNKNARSRHKVRARKGGAKKGSREPARGRG